MEKINKNEEKWLPIQRKRWETVPAETKTGKISKTRKKLVEIVIAEEQLCVKIHFTFGGKDYEGWVLKDGGNGSGNIYRENGEKIMGVWKHGYTGMKLYEQPLIWDFAENQLRLISCYHGGSIRDDRRFLKAII